MPAHVWSVALFCGSTTLAFGAASVWLVMDGTVVVAGIAVANCIAWGYGFVRSLRQGLYTSRKGLVVRNLWRTRSLDWRDVSGVNTSQESGRPGLCIALRSGESLRVNALSGSVTSDPDLIVALERVVEDLEGIRRHGQGGVRE